jgi:hypothetical protein
MTTNEQAAGAKSNGDPGGKAERSPGRGGVWAGLLMFVSGLGFETVVATLATPLVLRLLGPVVILLGVLTVARSGAPFHRDRVRESRWKLWLSWGAAAALLLTYLWQLTTWHAESYELAVRETGLWPGLATVVCLTTATTIALQTVLRPRPSLPRSLASLGLLLVGLAGVSAGVDGFAYGMPTAGALLLLLGFSGLLAGMGVLTNGITLLRIAALLCGVLGVWIGMGTLPYELPVAIMFLLFGASGLLCGVSLLTDGHRLLPGVASLLVGVAISLGSVGSLVEGDLRFGLPLLLLGVAASLVGVKALTQRIRRPGVTVFLLASAVSLLGVSLLIERVTLLSIAFLLFGPALLLLDVAEMPNKSRLRTNLDRVLAYLRAPAPSDDDRRD